MHRGARRMDTRHWPLSVQSSTSTDGVVADSPAKTVVVETGANCCFSDSTRKRYSIGRHGIALSVPHSKVQRQ